MKQLTATIITALFCAACGTTQLKNSLALELSDVDAIHIMPGTPHPIRADNAKIISTAELLDMVRQVDYIKLDSSEPIGVIDKMIVTKDKIYTADLRIRQNGQPVVPHQEQRQGAEGIPECRGYAGRHHPE